MIKHIVAWNFKQELSQQENYNNAKKVKEELEGLKDKIEEIKTIEVIRWNNSIKNTSSVRRSKSFKIMIRFIKDRSCLKWKKYLQEEVLESIKVSL